MRFSTWETPCLWKKADIVRIHTQVYAAVRHSVPEAEQEGLLGHQADAPADQNQSRELRSHDPYRFGEFLPLFAIRPLYNQLIYVAFKAGTGLIGSTILISAISYFLLGSLLFVWIRKRSGQLVAATFSSLLMISPPMVSLGRENISDALATLVAFASVYLVLENKPLTLGFSVLLASVYFRTDFVVLVGPVLVLCWLQRRITFWQTVVLSAMAVGSVFLINYCAGDYGIKMLYYRNFVGTPAAPAEMTALFSFHDYISGVRSGITLAAGSFFLPFLLLGLTGLFRAPRSKEIFAVAISYAALHFMVLPNWEERWFAIFYLSMGVVATGRLGRQGQVLSRDPAVLNVRDWPLLEAHDIYAESASGLAPGTLAPGA
jgi:hypothetical protein